MKKVIIKGFTFTLALAIMLSGLGVFSISSTASAESQPEPSLTAPEPVVGEWCSALYGIFMTAYNSPANYNAVADLNNDGVVSVSDFGMLAAIYGHGDNAGCYAQFEDPTANFHFDEENHLDIDWCNGLWQGIQDSFHSQSGDANYSAIFDLNGDGTIGILMVDMRRALGYTEAEINEFIASGTLNAFFIVGRSIGFIGHILDEKRLAMPMYRPPMDDLLYDVPVSKKI